MQRYRHPVSIYVKIIAFIIYLHNQFTTSMFWKPPQIQQNKSPSIFYLKNSRMSDNSTEIDRSFRLGTSFELDNPIIKSKKETKITLIRANDSFKDSQGKERIRNEGDVEQIKRKYLSKILISRMLNIRQAFKQIESLPITIFKNTTSLNMTKQILMKSKVNVEISVLRTLFFSHQNKNNENCKLKYAQGANVFVLPTPNKVNDAAKQEEALGNLKAGLEKLIEMANIRVKDGMNCLKKHSKEQTAIFRYFNKLCASYEASVEAAFSVMKHLPSKTNTDKLKSKLQVKQLIIITSILSNKYSSLLTHSLNKLRRNSQQQRCLYRVAAMQIINFAKLRKEQSLRQWMYLSNKAKKEEQVCEEKRQVLRRIVNRNYLKLFIEIIRRLWNFQRAAKRIGCGSKINEQKSFWRLLVNARMSKH